MTDLVVVFVKNEKSLCPLAAETIYSGRRLTVLSILRRFCAHFPHSFIKMERKMAFS